MGKFILMFLGVVGYIAVDLETDYIPVIQTVHYVTVLNDLKALTVHDSKTYTCLNNAAKIIVHAENIMYTTCATQLVKLYTTQGVSLDYNAKGQY